MLSKELKLSAAFERRDGNEGMDYSGEKPVLTGRPRLVIEVTNDENCAKITKSEELDGERDSRFGYPVVNIFVKSNYH